LIPTYATKPILSTPIYTVVDEKIRRKETNWDVHMDLQ
jgi:hypothetical protein